MRIRESYLQTVAMVEALRGENLPQSPQKARADQRASSTLASHINKSHIDEAQAILQRLTAALCQSLAGGCSRPNTPAAPSAPGDIIYTTATKSRPCRTPISSCVVPLRPHVYSSYSDPPVLKQQEHSLYDSSIGSIIDDSPVISIIGINAAAHQVNKGPFPFRN